MRDPVRAETDAGIAALIACLSRSERSSTAGRVTVFAGPLGGAVFWEIATKAPPEIAAQLGITRRMAARWRARFVEHRLDGLTDKPRPRRPRTVADEKVEHVIVKMLEIRVRVSSDAAVRGRSNAGLGGWRSATSTPSNWPDG